MVIRLLIRRSARENKKTRDSQDGFQDGSQDGPGEIYNEFQLDIEGNETVLKALDRVKREQDPSLVYRSSCHHGSCGTCGCRINDAERLACITTISDTLGDDAGTPIDVPVVKIEPLKKGISIADIAVGPEELIGNFPKDWSYVRESEVQSATEDLSGEVSREASVEKYTRFEDCIECGLCVSACPMEGDFFGPAVLAAYGREGQKQPEKWVEIRDLIHTEQGVWGCEEAFECSKVCPTWVYPSRHIVDMKRLLRPAKKAGSEDE